MGEPAQSKQETVHDVERVGDRFQIRAYMSLAGVAAFGVVGIVAVALTASRIDIGEAVFTAGIGLCVSAVVMLVCWGASQGHAELIRVACSGHQRVVEIVVDRLEGIEEIERETGKSVVIAMDEFTRRRRGQRGG